MTRLTALFLALFAALSAPDAKADMYKDARIILDAGEGQVRRWERSPRIAVIHQSDVDRTLFPAFTESFSSATGLQIGANGVEYFQLADDFAYTQEPARFEAPQFSDAPPAHFGRLRIGDGVQLESDIFVFVVNKTTAAYFATLTRVITKNASLTRQFIEGSTPCFYSGFSRDNVMQFAFIFINESVAPETRLICAYEELIQSLGLLNDAQDTPYFSLTNTLEKPKTNLDLSLLAAVYDAQVRPGDPVDNVIAVFRGQQ